MTTIIESDSKIEIGSQAEKELTRSVVVNQLLFSAGYALTSGGFLTYLAADLGASTRMVSWILALPELVGVLAVFTPLALQWHRSRKQLFLTTSISARCCLLLIPAAVFMPQQAAFPCFLAGMILTGIFQAFAYTAYLSWLSDLAPEKKWGVFFARRYLAQLLILLFVPFLGAMFRDWIRNSPEYQHYQLYAYVICLGLGNALQLGSLIPLLRWPDRQTLSQELPELSAEDQAAISSPATAESGKSDSSFWWVLIFSWWLAFFQGLTQTPFFLHSYRELQVSLTFFYLLSGSMYVVQMVTNSVAGYWGDQRGYRNILILSTFIASLSLIPWILSLSGNWIWLWGAYLIWGSFGAVNLSLNNLVLKTSPRNANTLPIALYRFGSGGIAGLTGLAGGYWLDQLIQEQDHLTWQGYEVSPYFILFAISFLGRITAPLWLWGLQEKRV